MVCALLHDIGDTQATNHADVAAVLLEAYVSEANHWMVKHHAIFRGTTFFTISVSMQLARSVQRPSPL